MCYVWVCMGLRVCVCVFFLHKKVSQNIKKCVNYHILSLFVFFNLAFHSKNNLRSQKCKAHTKTHTAKLYTHNETHKHTHMHAVPCTHKCTLILKIINGNILQITTLRRHNKFQKKRRKTKYFDIKKGEEKKVRKQK